MPDQRELVTIVFADVAGYTALMQKNETQAIALLSTFRSHMEKASRAHKGEIIQFYGDGCLLAFKNSTDAVRFALQVQSAFVESTPVPVRIGIHLGEVVFREGNMFGDGVNLASRVESISIPGAVLLSKPVRDLIRNKQEFQLHTLGSFHFKNVEEPMEVFALANPPLNVPEKSEIKGKLKAPPKETFAWNFSHPRIRFFKNIGIYLGVAWLAVELFALFINGKDLDPEFVNLAVIAACFGLVARIIYLAFKGLFNWQAIILQVLTLFLAISSIYQYALHPTVIDPGVLRIAKLTSDSNVFPPALKSLAVLPFTNLTQEQDNEYVLAGIQDGLITEMGKFDETRIISRTSTLAFRDRGLSMKEIAEELKVEALVEGTLTQVDSQMSLGIRVVNVFPQEQQVYAETYDSNSREIPVIYRQLALDLAHQLNYSLSPEEVQQLSTDISVNPEAYRYYAKGSYSTGRLTAKSFEKAEEYFLKAIALDSTFAGPYTGLAMIGMSQKQMLLVAPDSITPIIEHWLAKAKEVNGNSAEYWEALGTYHMTTTYDWEQAEESFRKAIEINPNCNRANFAHLLMIVGKWEEAWQHMHYASSIDPNNPWMLGFEGIMNGHQAKIITMMKYFDRLAAIEPAHPIANNARLFKNVIMGNYAQATQEFKQRLHYLQMESVVPYVDSVFQTSDWETGIRLVAEHIEEKARQGEFYASPAFFMWLYGFIEERNKWLDNLELLYETNGPDLGYYGIESPLTPFYNDPRHIKVMEKVGLK